MKNKDYILANIHTRQSCAFPRACMRPSKRCAGYVLELIDADAKAPLLAIGLRIALKLLLRLCRLSCVSISARLGGRDFERPKSRTLPCISLPVLLAYAQASNFSIHQLRAALSWMEFHVAEQNDSYEIGELQTSVARAADF